MSYFHKFYSHSLQLFSFQTLKQWIYFLSIGHRQDVLQLIYLLVTPKDRIVCSVIIQTEVIRPLRFQLMLGENGWQRESRTDIFYIPFVETVQRGKKAAQLEKRMIATAAFVLLIPRFSQKREISSALPVFMPPGSCCYFEQKNF